MNQFEQAKLANIKNNQLDYGDDYKKLSFVTESQAKEFSSYRQHLLTRLSEHAQFGYNNTKVDVSRLSPGCRLCAEGKWSCLFINGCCNAACFYCPTRQNDEGVPSTNTLEFPKPNDYVAYLDEFGFTGASLSGGEPLLTFDKSLTYLTKVKKHFGSRIYFWMYTNGLLFTPDIAAQLRDAGLDEIRFDIGATGYRLDYLKHAIGIIPSVTVEIPAVPEKKEKLQQVVRDLSDLGVNFLNLHQLRLTPHNVRHMHQRDYHFNHGEKITVPASELTALELIQFCYENRIDLPINYCSFVYKNRFQGAGARRRAAKPIAKSWETITENGYIRTVEVKAEHTEIEHLVESLQSVSHLDWFFEQSSNRLFVNDNCLAIGHLSKSILKISYAEASMRQNLSYRYPFRQVELSTGRDINIERWTVEKDLEISAQDFKKILDRDLSDDQINSDATLFAINSREFIRSGLADYY